MLKKFLLYIAFSLLFFTSLSQNQVKLDNSYCNKWTQCLESGYGKSSFFVSMTNEYSPSDGLYYYKIYLFNNSFNYNHYEVPTYLEGVMLYAYTFEKGVYLWKNVLTLEYVLIKPKSNVYNGIYYLGYVYSSNPNQKIILTWNYISNY